jgi:transposase
MHAICDGDARPLILLLSEGQMNEHKGAALILSTLTSAKNLIADTTAIGSAPRSSSVVSPPSTRRRKVETPHDRTLYRERHRIENTLGRLKDWRRIATR